MTRINRVTALVLLAPMLLILLLVEPAAAQTTPPPATYPALPSETPAKLQPATDSFDYIRRDVMIPMRDAVKLHTVILVPKGAKGAPILLTRTPYDPTELTGHARCPTAAFRKQNMAYIYEQEGTRDNKAKWWTDHFDEYDVFIQAGSAGELGPRHRLEQVGFWRELVDHPSSDAV